MRNESQPARELTLELQRADELFAGRGPDVAAGRPALPPGIDQIRDELGLHSRLPAAAAVIVLPRAEIRPDLARDITRAIEHYCEMGIRRADNELRVTGREGIRALVIGLILFAVFVSLSESVIESQFSNGIKAFFGDGLFLVVAWIGLWYPIDTLVYSLRPYRREKKVLQQMRRLEIVVRAADLAAPVTVWPGRTTTAGPRGRWRRSCARRSPGRPARAGCRHRRPPPAGSARRRRRPARKCST